MKKLTITVISLMMCFASFATDEITIIRGGKELSKIIAKDNIATLNINWDKAHFDVSKNLHDVWEDDYDFIVNDCLLSFIKGFNSSSKGMKITQEDGEPLYRIEIKMNDVDNFFHSVIGFRAKLTGKLKILDNNGDTIYEMDMYEFSTGRDYVKKECYGAAFEKLGEKLARHKIK